MGCFLLITEKDFSQVRQGPRQSASPQTQLARTVLGLAKYAPSILPYYLSRTAGKASYEMGKIGEQIAEKVLEQSQGLRIVERATGKGVDIKAQRGASTSVAVEVKTSTDDKPFGQLLGRGYGHKQCSDGWLKAVGVDPTQATVMGVHINPHRETVSIYRRVDSNADQWCCVMRDAPLSRFNIS